MWISFLWYTSCFYIYYCVCIRCSFLLYSHKSSSGQPVGHDCMCKHACVHASLHTHASTMCTHWNLVLGGWGVIEYIQKGRGSIYFLLSLFTGQQPGRIHPSSMTCATSQPKKTFHMQFCRHIFKDFVAFLF